MNLGGGMEYFIKDLVENLSDTNEITIVESESGNEFIDLKVKIIGAKIISLGNKSGLDLPSIRHFLGLRRLFLQADVVYYLSGFWNELYSVILQYLTRTPVIGFSWFLSDYEYRFKKYRKKEGDTARARIGTLILGPSLIRIGRFFRGYQVVSNRDYRYLRKLWKDSDKIREIPFGIPTQKYKRCKKEPVFTILYMARLDYQKGADLIEAIYEGIKRKLSDFRFIIVGTGRMESEVSLFAQGKKEVEVMGYVGKESEWKRYSDILCSSHVLISPIRYAGTTFTTIEALASGTPVVEFDVTGTRERIRDDYNGFIVENKDEMVEKVVLLYHKWKNEDGYDEFIQNSASSALNFKLETMVQKIYTMWCEVAKESSEGT